MTRKMKNLSWLYHSAKLLFLLSLATIQLIIFGIPSIGRFASSGIAEEKIIESQNALKPPGVTLCPFHHGQQGWRGASPDDGIEHPDNQSYTRWCSEAKNTTEAFESCVDEKTFDLKESVLRGRHGTANKANLSSPEFWTWDITTAFVGRCFSLNYEQQLGTDVLKDLISFDLNETLTYSIIIHDPNFGLPTFNPSTLPSIKTTISNKYRHKIQIHNTNTNTNTKYQDDHLAQDEWQDPVVSTAAIFSQRDTGQRVKSLQQR